MRLYLDFDGYFAAVEEQAAPALHGRPVAVLPYPGARTGLKDGIKQLSYGAPVPGGAHLRDLGERGGEAPRRGDGDRGGRGAAALPRDRAGGPAPRPLRSGAAPDCVFRRKVITESGPK